MNQKGINGENESQEKSDSGLKSFKLINERIEKRRRKASIGRLISLIIALIVIILFWLWARRIGM